MKISARIYYLIKRGNYKQSAIARAAGYDAKAFNNMLKDRKKIYADDIQQICTALRVTPNELFGIGEEVAK